MTYDYETAKDIWRDAILEAMDSAARRITGDECAMGATDANLPALFRALDAQLALAMENAGHPLYANWIGSEKYMAERKFLQSIGHDVPNDEALAQ